MRRDLMRRLLAAGFALAIAGAAGPDAIAQGRGTLPAAASPAAAFFAAQCPVAMKPSESEWAALALQALGAAAGAIAGPAIEGLFDLLGEQLDRQAEALKASSTALANSALHLPDGSALDDRNACLVFLRGGFGTGAPRPDPARFPAWTRAVFERVNGALRADGRRLSLNAVPEVYAEFDLVFERARVGDAERPISFGLKPAYLLYRQPGPRNVASGQKQLVFAIEFERRLAPVGDDKLARQMLATVIDLGLQRAGVELGRAELDVKVPRFQPLPPARLLKLRTVQLVEGRPVDRELDYVDAVPFTATVNLTESEEAGDAERLFARLVREGGRRLATPASELIEALIGERLGQIKPASSR